MILKKISFVIIATILTAAPTTTFATSLTNPLGTTSMPELAGQIIKAVLGLSGVAAFAMFIYGGLQLIISHGDKKMVETGKNTLTWASLGLIFIFIAYALLKTVLEIIGAAAT